MKRKLRSPNKAPYFYRNWNNSLIEDLMGSYIEKGEYYDLRRIYKNVLILDNEKDTILVAAKEHLGNVNNNCQDLYPVTIELPAERSYLSAIKRSLEYSKMGIFNLICRQ